MSDVPFTEKDYIPVARLDSMPRILSAHPGTPYNTVKEMVEYAKKNPGAIKVGVANVGTTDYLAFCELELTYGIKFNIIPQGGGGPARVALIGGHIDVSAPTLVEASPVITSGQVKSLGMMDSKRNPQFPDMKTCAEYGIPIEGNSENYLAVQKDTPPEIINMLQETFKKVLEDKGFLELAKKLNINVAYLDSAAAKKRLDEVRVHYKDLIQKTGIGKK